MDFNIFWRRTFSIIDDSRLSMHSRGVVFTNMMRLLGQEEVEAVERLPLYGMNTAEEIAYNACCCAHEDMMDSYLRG